MRANVGVKFISREEIISSEIRVTRCELVQLNREGCLILLNVDIAEWVYFFGVKTPPTCVVCITCRKGFSRERGVSNELREARYELNREGYLIPLNGVAFSALKRLPRV